jgi:hypothetical protein
MSQLEVDKVIPQSGTTLTLGDSADTITIPSGATLDASNATLTLPDGSVTAAKLDSTAVDNTNTNSTVITGQTAETSIDGADLVLLYDDSATALRKMTRTNFVSGLNNAPAFNAYISAASGTSMTANTVTKIICPTEVFDTASAYDTTTGLFTVPSGQAGKYLFVGNLTMYIALSNITCFFYINGGATNVNKPKGVGIYNNAGSATTITYVADLAEGDTVGLYGFSVATNAAQGNGSADNGTYFCGFKLI